MAESKVAVGRRLRYLRRQKGKTAPEVSKETGIPASTIFAYERGAASIPAERIEALARYFDVSPEWLLTGKESEEELKRKWPFGFQIFSRAATTLTDDDKRKLYEIFEYLIQHPELLNTIDVDTLVKREGKRKD